MPWVLKEVWVDPLDDEMSRSGYLTVPEAARALGVTHLRIRAMVQETVLASIERRGRLYINGDEVECLKRPGGCPREDRERREMEMGGQYGNPWVAPEPDPGLELLQRFGR
jgi:hypothetical protein